MDELVKKCKVCQEIKPMSEYWANPRTKDRKQGLCKKCGQEQHRIWSEENKTHLRQYRLANREKINERQNKRRREKGLLKGCRPDMGGEKNPNFRSAHITEDVLCKLYVREKLTSQECGERLNVSRATICRNLKRHGVAIITDREKLIGTCLICGKEFRYYPTNSKGIYCGQKCAGERMRGENNRNWVGGLVTVYCAYCGKSKAIDKSRGEMYSKHFCNPSCNGAWKSENQNGKNNWNWRGGKKGRPPYPPEWRSTVREQIRDRDNGVCQLCGKLEEENGRKMEVHHIDWDKKNLTFVNLISLCISCHSKAHNNQRRQEWQVGLTNIGNKHTIRENRHYLIN